MKLQGMKDSNVTETTPWGRHLDHGGPWWTVSPPRPKLSFDRRSGERWVMSRRFPKVTELRWIDELRWIHVSKKLLKWSERNRDNFHWSFSWVAASICCFRWPLAPCVAAVATGRQGMATSTQHRSTVKHVTSLKLRLRKKSWGSYPWGVRPWQNHQKKTQGLNGVLRFSSGFPRVSIWFSEMWLSDYERNQVSKIGSSCKWHAKTCSHLLFRDVKGLWDRLDAGISLFHLGLAEAWKAFQWRERSVFGTRRNRHVGPMADTTRGAQIKMLGCRFMQIYRHVLFRKMFDYDCSTMYSSSTDLKITC